MKRVLITGATGAVGPGLMALIHSQGYRIRVLVRDPGRLDLNWPDMEVVTGDITDEQRVDSAVKDVDIVFHLAAMLHNNHPAPGLENAYYSVNVMGTFNLLRASIKHNVRRFVFFSTISVYGPCRENQWADETSFVHPSTLYERTKAQAERLVCKAHETHGLETVILRLAAVYGKRIKGNYRTMVKTISKGVFVYPGSGFNKRTLVYEKDAARAALIAAEHPRAPGNIYNVTDGSAHTVRQIVHSMAAGLSLNILTLYLPRLPFSLIRAGIKKSFLFHFPLFVKAVGILDKMDEIVMVKGGLIMEDLGFKPEWNLVSGMKEMLG